MRERPWLAGRGEFFLIIDDYDIVASAPSHPLQPLVPYLFEAKDVGLHLITVCNANWSRAGFDPALAQLKSAGAPYLLMSADRSLSNPFGGAIAQRADDGRPRPPVTRRGARLIQTADLPPA
jgi:S-DNA-T family DNA segregation ATPase FtsK/SpoIIIE